MPSDASIGATVATVAVNNSVGVIAGFGTDTVSEGLILAIVGSVVGVAGSSIEIGVISALAGAIGASSLDTASSTVGVPPGKVAMRVV